MEHGPTQMSGPRGTGFGRRGRRQWSLPAGVIQEVQDILQETSGPARKQKLGRAWYHPTSSLGLTESRQQRGLGNQKLTPLSQGNGAREQAPG